MKKFLSILLALMLVLTVSAGIVMAEPEEISEQTEETQQPTAPEKPEDYDEESILEYFVFDFTDLENVVVSDCLTGTDGTLDYLSQVYGQAYQKELEEITLENERALVVNQSEGPVEKSGIVYIVNEGFLVNEKNFVIAFGDMTNTGMEEGKTALKLVTKFGKSQEIRDVVVGEQNNFLIRKYEINWVNLLIALMCLIVLVLLVVIVVLTIKKKKNNKTEAETVELADEEEVLDTVVSETDGIVEETETADIEETAEEAETTEETVEIAEETEDK